MNSKDLISKTIELELIQSLDDIEFLFDNYTTINSALTLNENIENVIHGHMTMMN